MEYKKVTEGNLFCTTSLHNIKLTFCFFECMLLSLIFLLKDNDLSYQARFIPFLLHFLLLFLLPSMLICSSTFSFLTQCDYWNFMKKHISLNFRNSCESIVTVNMLLHNIIYNLPIQKKNHHSKPVAC